VLALALAAFWAVGALAAERWRVQFFHDPADNSEFVIADFTFASPERGMAAGILADEHKNKPYAIATTNGGETWAPVRVPEAAISLFFVNANTGWLVGRDNIWRTSDFGETWKKMARLPGTVRVYFRDEQRGWAVGTKKSVHETSDGGATWKDVAAAAEPKTNPDNTVYGAIAFGNANSGMIAGWSKPPRRGEHAQAPDWIEPEQARREWPSLTILLQTRDGGAHWTTGQVSMFGQITTMSLAPDGRGLGLIEFFDKFDYPAEVYKIDWHTGKIARAFRRQDRAVTDVLVPPDGPAYIAAVEPSGTLPRSPVPGKLRILKSADLEAWQEMDVDYRAVARSAMLALAAPGRVWAATDTGMILKLAE